MRGRELRITGQETGQDTGRGWDRDTIVLFVLKLLLKRFPRANFMNTYLALPVSSIVIGVFFKVFKLLFSSSNLLINTLGFLPVYRVLYSIRSLISRNINIANLITFNPNLNPYVAMVISNAISPYWDTCLKYNKSFLLARTPSCIPTARYEAGRVGYRLLV